VAGETTFDSIRAPEALARRDLAEGAGPGRAVILAAAHEAIRDIGYQGLTVEEVRRRAGVSKATIYFHFRNKQHLFLEVARSVMDELYEVAGRHYPEREEYTRIVLANTAYLDVWRREHPVLGEFFAASLTDPELEPVYTAYRRKFEARIAGRLSRLAAQGRIVIGDPGLLATSLSAMVEFTAYRYFHMNDQAIRGHSFDDVVTMLSGSWFRAVYRRPAPSGPVPATALRTQQD